MNMILGMARVRQKFNISYNPYIANAWKSSCVCCILDNQKLAVVQRDRVVPCGGGIYRRGQLNEFIWYI